MEIDTSTKVQIAKTAHKVKGCLDGWKGEKTDKGVTNAPVVIVDLIGVGGLGVAIAAIVLASGGLLLDVVGSFLTFFAPYMIYQKHVLRDLGSFRSLLNDLRMQINQMMIENDKLSANVKKLSGNVDDLEKVEGELSKIVDGNSIDHLVDVVKETKEINEKIKKNTQSAIVQQLITTVLRTDRNSNLSIGPEEMKQLIISFEAQSSFTFHKFRFIQLIGGKNKDVPVEKIVAVIRNLKDDTIPEHKKIFSLKT